MKKSTCLLLTFIVALMFAACAEGDHSGEIKAPSGASDMIGQDYKDVIQMFETSGFTNIETKPIYDLIFGWLTKDGEVENVTVNGDSSFSSSKWFPSNAKIVIEYHTFPPDDKEPTTPPTQANTNSIPVETTVKDIILNTENCADLANLLTLNDPQDPFVKQFANMYYGYAIEFDGNIAYMGNHGNYQTRYDILIYAGNFNNPNIVGPNFQFVDVNIFDLNLIGSNIPDYISTGYNLHIIAEIGTYNEASGLLELKPISTEIR